MDRVGKQKCCLGPGSIKTVTPFLLNNFFDLKLGRMLCNSYSNCFFDFYIFPIVGIDAINFQSKKRQSTLVLGCFSLQKKWKNSLISKILVNHTM